jgi:peptide deformylase
MNILKYPNPQLRQLSKTVSFVNEEICKLMDDMLQTMWDAKGCGLAAPQVGVLKRIIVMDLGHEYPNDAVHKMVNPEIIWKSKKKESFEEGCLSIPGEYGYVERPECVKIRYLNEKGKRIEKTVDGLFAVCVQHEIDHLNGHLFIDYVEEQKVAVF